MKTQPQKYPTSAQEVIDDDVVLIYVNFDRSLTIKYKCKDKNMFKISGLYSIYMS